MFATWLFSIKADGTDWMLLTTSELIHAGIPSWAFIDEPGSKIISSRTQFDWLTFNDWKGARKTRLIPDLGFGRR